MAVEPRSATLQINKGLFSPLYLLYGEELFMIDEMLTLLKEKVIGADGLADFNLITFYATDCEVEGVIDSVHTLPMMAQKRLVILKKADDLTSNELDKLVPLVENPVDSTVFVLVANKIDLRKKFFKAFDKNGVVVKFQKPFENQLSPWISHIAKKHGKILTPQAIELIKECVGPHLSDINNELAKAASFIGEEKKELDVKDLENIITRSRIDNVFQLVNCMGDGNAADSFVHLANLLDNGENEIAVLTMIIRHYRILMLCHEGLKEGLSASQIASRVGVPSFFIKDYVEQSKKLSLKTLQNIYTVLLDTDRALKSSPLSSHLWLENLVLQACRTEPSTENLTNT